jgi:FkbM family methyltransferase
VNQNESPLKTMNDPSIPEFGQYAPNAQLESQIKMARKTSFKKSLYVISSLCRKKALKRIGNTPVDYEFRGLRARFRPNGNTAEKRALLNPARFDLVELDYLEKHLPEGGIFLDIGANAGLYALVAAKTLGPAGRVLAFEPNPEVIERLSFNIASNLASPATLAPINLIQKAVTSENGPVFFAKPAANLGEGRVVATPSGGQETLELEGTTLMDCLVSFEISGIHGLKIDIEGHELPALQPFFQSAPHSLKPGFVIIERGDDAHWEPLESLLTASGYVLHASTRMNEIYILN